MPAKKKSETPEQQAARFREEVKRLVADGELSLTEADAAFEKIMGRLKQSRR